jgi:Flp pilus assembly pilin Flp
MFWKFLQDESASTTVEYAILAALVAATLITALTNFTDVLGSKLTAGGEQLKGSDLKPN